MIDLDDNLLILPDGGQAIFGIYWSTKIWTITRWIRMYLPP